MPETARITIVRTDEDAETPPGVSRALAQAGFDVEDTIYGQGDLARDGRPPSLILLSVPHADDRSLEICRRLKQDHATSTVPLLLLSCAVRSSAERALEPEKGADGFLAGSVEPLELLAAVRTLLRLGRAEERLLLAAEQWRASFDAIREQMCLLDLEGRILRCNRALKDRLGKPYAEIVGRHCTEILCPPLGCSPECPFLQLRETRRRQIREVRQLDRWYHVTADPVTEERGALTGAVLVITDMTEEKRSELLYRMLMDAIPMSVLLIDEALQVVLVNQNFLEKAGRRAGETLGRPLAAVFPEVVIEELGLERQIQEVFESNEAKLGRRLAYRAPGIPLRIYYYSVIPVSWGARADHVMLLLDDVTEQVRMSEEIRRTQSHLAGVVECASDIVVSLDVKGKILTWNPAGEKISGYSLQEVAGRPLFEFCEPASRHAMERFFSAETGLASPSMAECDLLTKQGRGRPISWVVSPMLDGPGQTVGLVAVGRDLTEQRKFETQLLQSERLAALGVMAGGIAHEIRTPLAISSSAAQFLMEADIAPEFRRECAEKVNRGIQRASAIIENLLRLAHPSREVQMAPVDLASVLQEALGWISGQARIQGITVLTQFPDQPLQVCGVASMLEQVFMNLFLNAINAMPGGGTLQLSLERCGGEARICVADNGVGISKDDLNFIFDPFFTKAPIGKGTGLGLSICYSILKQHRASIEVESEEGRGSVFTVRFPLP